MTFFIPHGNGDARLVNCIPEGAAAFFRRAFPRKPLQAWHDTLTRLYNRGALFEKARPLAKLCQTHQHPFSVIQVDLDHFKAINDRFGHLIELRENDRIIGSNRPESAQFAKEIYVNSNKKASLYALMVFSLTFRWFVR